MNEPTPGIAPSHPCPLCRGTGQIEPRGIGFRAGQVRVEQLPPEPCPTCRPLARLRPGEIRVKLCTDGSQAHRWQSLGTCTHSPRFGEAFECADCGSFGHRWTVYACARRRQTNKEIEAELAACPIEKRKRGEVPAPVAAEGS